MSHNEFGPSPIHPPLRVAGPPKRDTKNGLSGDRGRIGVYDDALNAEVLFHDEIVVVAGLQTRWARRRKIDIGELTDERWILSRSDTWNYSAVEEAFRERRLEVPHISIKTLSVHVRANLLATGKFITVMPKSVLHLYGNRFSLKILPIDLPIQPWPVAIVTLKNRTLSPLVERFIECAREIVRPLASNKR